MIKETKDRYKITDEDFGGDKTKPPCITSSNMDIFLGILDWIQMIEKRRVAVYVPVSVMIAYRSRFQESMNLHTLVKPSEDEFIYVEKYQ